MNKMEMVEIHIFFIITEAWWKGTETLATISKIMQKVWGTIRRKYSKQIHRLLVREETVTEKTFRWPHFRMEAILGSRSLTGCVNRFRACNKRLPAWGYHYPRASWAQLTIEKWTQSWSLRLRHTKNPLITSLQLQDSASNKSGEVEPLRASLLRSMSPNFWRTKPS